MDEEYLYLPCKDKIIQVPVFSRPLPTKNGYVHFINVKQNQGKEGREK